MACCRSIHHPVAVIVTSIWAGFTQAPFKFCYVPVILLRFGRYVVPTLFTPTFRRNWCWFRLCATLCHDVLRCCHAIATPEPRHCPILTRLTSDTGKFSYVVLRDVSLSPRWSLVAATLSYAVPRCASLLPRNSLVSVLGYINIVTCDTRLTLAHNRYPDNMTLRIPQRFIFVQQRIGDEARRISPWCIVI